MLLLQRKPKAQLPCNEPVDRVVYPVPGSFSFLKGLVSTKQESSKDSQTDSQKGKHDIGFLPLTQLYSSLSTLAGTESPR